MEALEQAAYEVEVYENRIDVLLSVHRESAERIDWLASAERAEPTRPLAASRNELSAKAKLDAYEPGLFARLFKLQQRQIDKLADRVEIARALDAQEFEQSVSAWRAEHSEWSSDKALAERLLVGDTKAKMDAIELFHPFEDVSMLGSSIAFQLHSNGVVEAVLNVHGERVVPSETKSLLQSGKLSTKKMPAGRFNELLQDYVCSCALRVGRELLAILPDDLVIVTATDRLLNAATGHLEEMPLLSVAISRRTLEALNLDAIDPSDSMKNFVHNMSFKKTTGFTAVSALPSSQFSV
ncbi:hypothetical protein ACMYUJ_19390 [Stutzerimonas zhaodongensis]|uniref:hypothetical protein n=1 Tax=Stutzerimonas zhaodongensis TaxID=1176257 RepID=UPI0039F0253D